MQSRSRRGTVTGTTITTQTHMPTIQVLIRTGTKGLMLYKGIESLANRMIPIVNVRMTWVEVFQNLCGVYVDPECFTLQRRQRTSMSTLAKHNLNEEVRGILQEFRRPGAFFTIYLIAIRKSRTHREREDNNAARQNMSPLPPVLSPAIRLPKNGGYETYFRTPVITSVLGNQFNNSSSLPEQDSMQRDKMEIGQTKIDGNRINGRLSAAIAPQKSTVSQHRYREVARRSGPPVASGSRAVQEVEVICIDEVDDDDGGEDQDAQSYISNNSQDSQMEDLLRSGVQLEDVKTSFCAKLKKGYTNTQLLKMRHEIRELRRNNGRRWSKWTTAAPVTAHIIRELFDV